VNPLLLIVDDDPTVRTDLPVLLDQQYRCEAGEDLPSARARIERGGVELVLLDVHLGDGVTGFDLLDWLRDRDHAPSVVMMSDRPGVGIVVEAMRRGARSFLAKSANTPELLAALQAARGPEREHPKGEDE
jgi:DNA-binding NtrC family response regulator